ncbi:MAG: hypothetical protein JF922_00275 [Candidatus Dormibacteraeota bacterium]|uniref:Uncharacterized protein n=1 Tax=Candidatus Nephthysia bennettiae TaxID=3127016 RepID=A0A934JYK7_9BACT|nr:hypothetical protein [Candidatus Dormibacteraeota bacterium]
MKEANQRKWISALMFFGIGAISAAALGGLLISLAHQAVGSVQNEPLTAFSLWVICGSLALADLGLFGLNPPSIRRQTSPHFWRMFGLKTRWYLWGADLGLGFSTIRVTSLFWATIIITAVLLTPPWTLVPLFSYSIGTVVGVVTGTLIARVARFTDGPQALSAAVGYTLTKTRLVRVVSGGLLFSCGTVVMMSTLLRV